jgi:hypothetical protein
MKVKDNITPGQMDENAKHLYQFRPVYRYTGK